MSCLLKSSPPCHSFYSHLFCSLLLFSKLDSLPYICLSSHHTYTEFFYILLIKPTAHHILPSTEKTLVAPLQEIKVIEMQQLIGRWKPGREGRVSKDSWQLGDLWVVS